MDSESELRVDIKEPSIIDIVEFELMSISTYRFKIANTIIVRQVFIYIGWIE